MSHGKSRTRTYTIWQRMKDRCTNKKSIQYKDYGGRGIKLCYRWYDFANFLWDMGECPEDLTLEREDTNKGYELSNCRWATMQDQQRNRTNNKLVTYKGETKCVAEWSEESGIPYHTLYARLFTYGHSVDRAMEKV